MSPGEEDVCDSRAGLRGGVTQLLVLLLCVLGSTFLRARTALDAPDFPPAEASRVRSDPGLIYYVADRIAEGGGGIAALRELAHSDPLVEHPEGRVLLEDFTIAQEFPIAWLHRLAGGHLPLSESALWAMAFFASLGAVGAWLLAKELTGSRGLALGAALLWALLPANYRTIGFVAVREDFSFPFFALHLGLLARAVRLGGAPRFALAGVALGIALASWHASGFLLLLEIAACGLAYVLRGTRIGAARGAWALAVVVAIFGLAVPALRAKAFLVSPAVLLAVGLVWARAARAGRLGLAWLGAGAAALALARVVPGAGEHAHVAELVLAKLLLFGERPPQPDTLSFDVRLMWQSSFETLRLPWTRATRWVPALVLFGAAFLSMRRSWRAEAAPFEPRPAAVGEGSSMGTASRAELRTLIVLLALLSLPAAWLLQRLVILPGLLGPAVAVGLMHECVVPRLRASLGVVALALQAAVFVTFLQAHQLRWHHPPDHRAELAAALERVEAVVPLGEAVASDFVTSTAVLAHARRPILFQPKYERAASRRRIEEFTSAFFEGEPAALRTLLLERFRCRWLLLDRVTLGRDMRYLAGIADGLGEGLLPGGAAARLLGGADAGPAGYERVDLGPGTFFRLYRLSSEPPR